MRAAGAVLAVLAALMVTGLIAAWALGWQGGIDWSDSKAPRLIWLASLVALFGAGIMRRQRLSTTALTLGAWVCVFAVVLLGYTYRSDLKSVWGHVKAELFTGETVVTAPGEIQVARANDKHFHVTGQVNEASVSFVIDTGASSIALSWADARAAGLDPKVLEFNQKVQTASGPAQVAAIRIARLMIGPIERRDIAAVVLPEGVSGSLLGLGFLDTLKSYEISGDHLTMRD